jgi:hypothetical protein
MSSSVLYRHRTAIEIQVKLELDLEMRNTCLFRTILTRNSPFWLKLAEVVQLLRRLTRLSLSGFMIQKRKCLMTSHKMFKNAQSKSNPLPASSKMLNFDIKFVKSEC